MGAFDRLQNYSATNNTVESEVFDVTTPQGCFLHKLHTQGYKMYEYEYVNNNGTTLSEERFQWLSEDEKVNFTKNLVFTELHNMLTTSGDQLVLANAGSGKALTNDTLVMTPKGYKPIGKLTTSDQIYGTDLKPHKVVGVYPQGKKQVYKVTIQSDWNNVDVLCCSEHLWSVRNWHNRDSKEIIEVLTTKDIKNKLNYYNSLYLDIPSPFKFDSCGENNLTDSQKAKLLFNFLRCTYEDDFTAKLLSELIPKIKDTKGLRGINTYDNLSDISMTDFEYTECGNKIVALTEEFFNSIDYNCNILESKFTIKLLGGFCNIDIDLVSTYLLNSDICSITYSNKDANDITFTIDTKFFLTSILTNCRIDDKNIEDLANGITSACYQDFFKALHGKGCVYRITNVEVLDEEQDMTCIEVDTDNHLFLLKELIPTHNTTALIFKIMHDIITGESTKMVSIPNGNSVRVVDDIFVGTFLKTGADELAERLAYWQRGLGYTVTADRINFSTLHAEFKRALNTMGAATPIGSASDINKCLKKAIDGLGITRDSGGVLTAEDYTLIGGIVTYYRGRLDNKKYNHPSANDYGLTPVILDRLVSDFANQRQLAGIMDFEDLQELLYKFLYVTPNKAVQDFCANRYKYIYLDEFQDTSQIQYAIIKFYARGRLWLNRGGTETSDSPLYTGVETLGKIVVVGDNDQCVTGDTTVRVCTDWDCAEFYSAPEFNPTCKGHLSAMVEECEFRSNYLPKEFTEISKIRKGEFICCADNLDRRYSGLEGTSDTDDIYNQYGYIFEGYATRVIEDPIKHKRKNIDLYKITVEEYYEGKYTDFVLECSGDHILFTDDKRLAIPDEVYKALIEDTEEGSVERGFFILDNEKSNREFTMVYVKNLTIGDKVVVERFGNSLTLGEVTNIEKVHYDEVDLYDIRTDARNYSANNIISHNCLYQWRGSDNAIIEEMFDSDFRPCHTSLSYNYRCPSNILDAIVPSIKMNKGHESREYHSARQGGIAKGYHFTSYKAMLNQLVIDIDENMQEGNTVAILCRTNYDGVIPAFILEANKNYNFSISGQNMTLDSPLPKKLIAVSSIFTERSSPAVKNTLSMFVPRFAEWGVKQLVDTLKNNSKSIWQIPEADIQYSCPELAPMIKDLKSIFYDNGKRVQKKEIEALKFIYHWLMVNTFSGSSLFCESARAYIEALLYIIDSNDFESVFEYLDYVTTLNDKLHARINNNKANICIATVHEFKGKERDTVIVWNDSEGVFPSNKTDVNNLDELEGERMVHYVACTRARKKNIIYTLFGKEGMFVQEMDLEFESPQQLGGTLKSKKGEEVLSEDEQNLLDVMSAM